MPPSILINYITFLKNTSLLGWLLICIMCILILVNIKLAAYTFDLMVRWWQITLGLKQPDEEDKKIWKSLRDYEE